MKGIYFNGTDAVYREDLPVPVMGEKESLVKILLCAVCNTDKEVRKGYRPDFRGVMGHEFVGEVVESSDESLVGKRVVGELNATCGNCVYCKTGRPTHCNERRVLGMKNKDGAFAEYMTIDTNLLHVVPDELPTEIAIFTEPLAAAFEILTQVHVSPGKNAAVLGDGRLALFVAQVLAQTGIDLTVIGKHEEKLKLFESFAKVTMEGEAEGYEYVAECTGSPSGLQKALDLVRKKGTIILKSTYAGTVDLNMSMVAVNEISIVGSRCGPFEPALKMLKEGKITLPAIEIYECKDYEKAFESGAFKAGMSF